jgi:hypothetical protein
MPKKGKAWDSAQKIAKPHNWSRSGIWRGIPHKNAQKVQKTLYFKRIIGTMPPQLCKRPVEV